MNETFIGIFISTTRLIYPLHFDLVVIMFYFLFQYIFHRLLNYLNNCSGADMGVKFFLLEIPVLKFSIPQFCFEIV